MASQPNNVSIPENSWYPNVTPYRLVVITTTGGLGIAKAVLVAKNETTSSTTVEWITGVVVGLAFQFLGSYEYSCTRPERLDWMFCYNYNGRRIQTGHQDYSDTPPLATGYRLLVSASFTAFGLVKMACGYLGFSTAMNTLDWVIAVPLTLGLYCMGLYEENSSVDQRRLFDVDFSPKEKVTVLTVLLLVIRISSATFCVWWFTTWIFIFHDKLTSPSDAVPIDTWLEFILDAVEKSATFALYFGITAAGYFGLIATSWPLIRVCSGKYTESIRHYTRLTAIFVGHALAFFALPHFFVSSLLAVYYLAAAIFTGHSITFILYDVIVLLVGVAFVAFLGLLILAVPFSFVGYLRQPDST